MERNITALAILVFAMSSVVSASDVVYDTIGPTFDEGVSNNTLFIGGSGDYEGQRGAAPFTPTASGLLASVEMPVLCTSPSRQNGTAVVSLYSDVNGQIGSLLEVIDSGSLWPEQVQVVQFNSSANTPLVAGTQYWVVADAPLDDSGDYAWHGDANQSVGTYAWASEDVDGGVWNDWNYVSNFPYVRNSMRVSVQAVPTPVALPVGLSAIMLLVTRRRR